MRALGIVVVQIDATHWDSSQKEVTLSRESRAKAMWGAHEAAAYNEWLASEIQASVDDKRPNVSHEEVLDEMEAEVAAL